MVLTIICEIDIWKCYVSYFQSLMCTYTFKLMTSIKMNAL